MKKADKIEEIFKSLPMDEYLNKKLDKLPKDLPKATKQKLLNDSKFLSEYGLMTDTPEEYEALLKKHKKALNDINIDKKGYPNYDEYISFTSPRDTEKWVNAAKNIYYQVYKGIDRKVAVEDVSKDWGVMEKRDFQNWLKFYEENSHKKYAQMNWLNSQFGDYFVPLKENNSVKDVDPTLPAQPVEQVQPVNNKREIIEEQRNKIVSRLDSAEKLLRSQEGQIFAGNEFEALMHIIYELKKKIHTVNKMSISTKLYEDMIVRSANVLNKQGFVKASDVLNKIAEEVALSPAPPPNPTVNVGVVGTLPGVGPGMTPPGNITPNLDSNHADIAEGLKGFLDGLNGKVDDHESDDIEVIEDADTNFVVEAQDGTPQVPRQEPLEVKENVSDGNFDSIIDQAFKNLKVEDVVAKLEDLAKIFKTREIPRQLAVVDMMLDRLGFASFFPSLAEATNKSLESNQYISTRVEDILSKLRGTIETREIDLKNEAPAINTPEVEAARKSLKDNSEKELAKKKMRKELEDKSLEQASKPEPELEVKEDLGTPSQTTNVMPPAAPIPPAQ